MLKALCELSNLVCTAVKGNFLPAESNISNLILPFSKERISDVHCIHANDLK